MSEATGGSSPTTVVTGFTGPTRPPPCAATTPTGTPCGRPRHVRASGLTYTFLRDDFYAEFVPDLVGEDGAIRGPAGRPRGHDVRPDRTRVALAARRGSHPVRAARRRRHLPDRDGREGLRLPRLTGRPATPLADVLRATAR
ncbi:hypothetical protein ACKI2C_01845 [Streptomyces brasiliscabiei]|uniref:hypothetical protein n=1 Tax=Streptomyces brasiliscabiei TaxID=2736302 RepID=UPI0038F77B0C